MAGKALAARFGTSGKEGSQLEKNGSQSLVLEETCAAIRSLKIQGARNIALAAIGAMDLVASTSTAGSSAAFYGQLVEAADALASTRPTEPMLRNSIRYLLAKVEKKLYMNVAKGAWVARPSAALEKQASRDKSRALLHMKWIDGAGKSKSRVGFGAKPQKARMRKGSRQSVSSLKNLVKAECKAFARNMEASIEAISQFGAAQVPNGATVLVHCHSSTVVGILKKAFQAGRLNAVYCTETRPKYQGRITARELAQAGIDTTLIVDSAVATFLPKCNMVLVGADAITSAGDLVNKIGTAGIARLASMEDVPFYSAAELYKFEPITVWGKSIEIEERDIGEVAGAQETGKGVKIRNPAFDITGAKYIHAYITEKGVVPPASLITLALEEFNLSGA
ncbi:S-methyl-5-thioribose-1-phosphate isomerase [Candidatus Parvarchaeota archaeon]|nr:S-methyl-5-thioribose-1-phosphate isomerase [Candidatus Parvarchaeota archaeon]